MFGVLAIDLIGDFFCWWGTGASSEFRVGPLSLSREDLDSSPVEINSDDHCYTVEPCCRGRFTGAMLLISPNDVLLLNHTEVHDSWKSRFSRFESAVNYPPIISHHNSSQAIERKTLYRPFRIKLHLHLVVRASFFRFSTFLEKFPMA